MSLLLRSWQLFLPLETAEDFGLLPLGPLVVLFPCPVRELSMHDRELGEGGRASQEGLDHEGHVRWGLEPA